MKMTLGPLLVEFIQMERSGFRADLISKHQEGCTFFEENDCISSVSSTNSYASIIQFNSLCVCNFSSIVLFQRPDFSIMRASG